MNRQAEARHVGAWLNDLALLTAGDIPLSETKAKIAALAGVLADDYPAEAFCRQSLTEIGRRIHAFPSYGQLCEHLGAWWAANQPQRVLPGPTVDADLPAADLAMVGFWNDYRSGAKTLPHGVTLEGWLSMCRNPCAKAFSYICRTDAMAAGIAVKRGWMQPPHTEPTDAEREAVRIKVQSMFAKVVALPGDRVGAWPHGPSGATGDPVPAPASAAMQKFELERGRKMGALSDEQLAEVRKAANSPLAAIGKPAA